MSSPFQQGFMSKNPFRTAKRMIDAAKTADTEFYKDIDPYEAEGNRMEAAEQLKPLAIDDKTSYDYDYDQNPETTASLDKKKSPLNNNSPLYGAYASGTDGAFNTYRPSDRPAFEALQGKISANTQKISDATKKKKTKKTKKADNTTETTNKKDKSAEALNKIKLKNNKIKTLQDNSEVKYVEGRFVRVDKEGNFYNLGAGEEGGNQIGSFTGKKNVYETQKEKEDKAIADITKNF